jgi:hypothetical protein
MTLRELFSDTSAVLMMAAFLPMLYGIVKRGYKPPLSTFVIWLSLDVIIAVGMSQAETLNKQLIGAIIGATAVCVALLKFGSAGWSRTERNQIIGGAIGIAVWMYLDESIVGIITGCALLVYGGLPTFAHAWNKPEEYAGKENRAARVSWALFWLSCPFQVASLGHPSVWTWESALQPLTFLFIETVMVSLIFIRPALSRPRAELA